MAYNPVAQALYDKKCKQLKVKLFPTTDRDIIEFIDNLKEPKATLVKRLLREEMKRLETAPVPKE